MQKRYDEYRTLVESKLKAFFTDESAPQAELFRAMRYSLLAGGKRIRPVIVLEFCRACGGAPESAVEFACGIEMLHTYSLIHDDMPCMDNDELRRGKPTNHVVFGETTAVLAGDALQAAAFETVLSAELPAEAVVNGAKALALAAGELGICGGQILDMEAENKSLDLAEVENIHELKTASMIEAAAKMGCFAGCGTTEQIEAARKYARAIGLAFQIEDDLLDFESTTEELGKPVGSDKENGKSTFAILLGGDKCREIIRAETEKAKQAVISAFDEPEFLCWLADKLANRSK